MGYSIRQIRPSRQTEDRQPPSTDDDKRQVVQRDFAGVVEIREPVWIDWRMVETCKDELDAVNLCINLSGHKDEWLCSQISIDKGHWSRMRKGVAHFPTAKRLDLQRLCGNWAPLQFEMLHGPSIRRVMEEIAPPSVAPRHPAASRGYLEHR